MSGTFPTNILPRALNLINKRPTLVNETASGKRVTRKYGSQYFVLEVTLPPLGKNNGISIFGFLQQQQGAFEKFDYRYPTDNAGIAGTQTITARVAGAHSVGDSTIDIDTFDTTATSGDLLKRGDLVKFAGHEKVYMIKASVDMPTAGTDVKTLSIEPPLVAAVANNQTITLNTPKFQVYLTDDVIYNTDANGLYYISFTMRECIE
jgi:hypothetical protein